VILYEMITRKHPFNKDLKKILLGEEESLPDWVDEDTRALVKNLLNKNPMDRMKIQQIKEWLVKYKLSKLSVQEEDRQVQDESSNTKALDSWVIIEEDEKSDLIIQEQQSSMN
jgi:serine/threonine protein kinase